MKGRTDKKFCDDYCRNSYHNLHKLPRTVYMRNVDNLLHKNRQILEQFFVSGQLKVKRRQLERAGFLFAYHTDAFTNKQGNTYHYCYEYGYIDRGLDWFLIVKRPDHW